MSEESIAPHEINPNSPSTLPVSSGFNFSGEVKEEGVFASLIASVRDLFGPKLPPLVLESKPVAVPDRMKTKMDPRSYAGSILTYALLIGVIAWLVSKHVQFAPPKKFATLDISAPITPPPAKKLEKIGGGGGQHDLAPVAQGHLPKFADKQIVPPVAPPPDPPKLAVEPTLVVQKDLKMADNNMPNIGLPTSSLHGVSLGNGNGSGLGSGNGNGLGPGSGGNTGGGVFHIGGGVSAPKVVYQVDAEFSDEARKAKFDGNVLVALIVDENGTPTHVHITRPIGMGLDDKAIEAVRQWKFKPCMKDGHPVKCDLSVDVNFRIF